MATAVSLKGDCGFDYLELFDQGEDVGQIILKLENKFGKAWANIEVIRVKSLTVNRVELRMAIDRSISKCEQEENE